MSDYISRPDLQTQSRHECNIGNPTAGHTGYAPQSRNRKTGNTRAQARPDITAMVDRVKSIKLLRAQADQYISQPLSDLSLGERNKTNSTTNMTGTQRESFRIITQRS